MNTKLVVALLGLGMLSGLLLVAPPAAGVATLTLDPPKYNPIYYVPGESIQFTLGIAPADARTYDLAVVWDDGVTFRNESGNVFNDVTIPGTATSLPLSWTLPAAIRDGDFYYIRVFDSTWIESGGAVGNLWDEVRFSIRTWSLSLELDRNRYLPGDTVNVLWSVNLIRDGSLAPSGYGQIWVWEFPGGTRLISPFPFTFTASTGTFSFTLLSTILTNRVISAYAYFNSTASNADRFSYDTATATVDGLRMLVNVLAASYQPGGIVTVDIAAKNTDFAPNWNDPGAANVEVDIAVADQTTGLQVPQYGALNLVTDIHGNLRHVFQLNATIADGTQYLVRADGVANNAVTGFATDTFTVTSRAGMTLVLTFDKSQYLSGDTVTMTVDVIGNPGPFTYIYETRDGATGNLYNRQTKVSTDPTPKQYQYAIPASFDGSLTFYATVDDGNGNRRTDSRNFQVVLGVLAVTLDRSEFNVGDMVTATYALTKNAAVMTNPTYYYEIFDSSVVPNVLVKSGVATGGSVPYQTPQAPQVPANQYRFQVTAAEAGRSVSGSATATLASGVLLSIGFDKDSYMPGETVRIDYTLTARGRTRLPTSLTFYVAMAGAPSRTVQATSTSGTQTSGSLYYTIPAGSNEGRVPIAVQELSTNAYAQETITVGPSGTFYGIPTFSVILGLLMLLAFILIVLMWYRLKPGMAGPKPHAEKPSPPPPATAAPGPAPMTVTCKACGAPIEITTSKRPIEVMCPSCGETQMVQ